MVQQFNISSEWFNIRRRKEEHKKDANKISSETEKYLELLASKQILKSHPTHQSLSITYKCEWKNNTMWTNKNWIIWSSNNFL